MTPAPGAWRVDHAPPTSRRLVINADDLGLAESVNRGIVEAIEHGVVTSTSIMVNLPSCADAARRLRAVVGPGARVSVGLHLNLVAGPPLTACPSLRSARTGRFLPLPVLAWKVAAGRVDLEDVRREVDAQLRRAGELLSPLELRITHLDSHQHAHCLPGVFEVVLRAAEEHGVAHVRHPRETELPLPRRARAAAAASLLRIIVGNRRPPDDIGFAGIRMMGSMTFERDVLELVAAIPAGTTELMVHPGYDSPELAAIDRYRAARERELRALTSPALRERIHALGVELTPFGATAPPASPPTRAAPAAS